MMKKGFLEENKCADLLDLGAIQCASCAPTHRKGCQGVSEVLGEDVNGMAQMVAMGSCTGLCGQHLM